MSFRSMALLAFVAATLALVPLVRADEASETKAYEDYDNCVKQVQDQAMSFDYGMWSLKKIHKGISEDVLKCNAILPKENQAENQRVLRAVTLMTTPQDRDGAEKGPVSISTGYVLQTGTGSSLRLDANAGLNLPKASMFSLEEGYKLSVSGTAYVGSNVNGVSQVPVAHGSIVGSKGLDLKLDDSDRATIAAFTNDDEDKDDKKKKESPLDSPWLKNLDDVGVRQMLQMSFDRNEGLAKPWETYVGYGLEGHALGDSKGGVVQAVAEGGVGKSGDVTRLFARLNIGGKAFYCPYQSQNKRHLVCMSALLAARMGAIELGGDVGVGGYYQYKINQEKKPKWLNSISVGSDASLTGNLDQGGSHGALNWNVLSVTVK